jgi:putative DNA primase/helicase
MGVIVAATYIKKIAATALGNIGDVLNSWLPGGKREGSEYLTLNPKRADSAPGSFSINLKTGKWSDFATGDKGLDLVALVAYLEGETQGKAARRLAAFLGLEQEESSPPKPTSSGSRKPGNGKPSTNNKEANAATVPPGSDGDGWQCVMPVPDDAPPPPAAHSKHGKPSRRYPYLAQDGRINFYHDRYDKPKGEKKQFSPLTLWQKAGKYEWRFKVSPGLRPLNGLPGLLQFPVAVCWFTEGEKAAEALQKLLSDHPVLCWQGGSQAVDKSDYSPLSGRDCVIFPDYDLPGKKAAGDLLKRLTAAGASSVRVLHVDRMERAAGEPLQTGYDAADLVACGWDADRFAEFLKREDAFLPDANPGAGQPDLVDKPDEPQAATPQRGFELLDDGLYFLEPTKDSMLRRRKVCARLEVLALARDTDSREWGTLVRFADPDNKVKQLVIPARSFNGDGLEASGRLLSEGLTIAPKSRQLVIEYLQTQTPTKRARTTNRTGWHGVGNDLVFVLPDGSLGQSDDEWLFADNRPDSNLFRSRGTLKQWREQVAALCVGNSRLTFAVSVAFASPLLHLIEMESGGFHYRGTTSSGKTSALIVAGSVCGSPEYLHRWRSTDNGLESTALSHCDALLTLDELKMIDARIAGESAYMLANGAAKVRANVTGGARSTAKWRLLFLSAGELSLAQHVAESGKKTPAGAELRMADIPADAGQGLGCFENLHGFDNGHEFAKALGAAVNKYYGTAFPAFIESVLRYRETLRESLFDARQTFEKATLTHAASGQAQRVAARFALTGAAGELATDWGITGWQPGASMQAAITCFKAWLQAFGGEGNKEERAMIEQVRHFLELHGESRFTDIERTVVDDNHTPRTMNKAGFRQKNHESNLEYYCYPEVFKAEICKGFDYKAVARLLIERGFMKGDGKNLQPKVNLPGEGRKRVFHILPTIWEGESD